MAQKPYHHGDLKNALIDAALGLLRERPDEEVSLREVAKRVGVSPNAPYRHFHDKEDLMSWVAERGFRELTRRFRAVDHQVPEKWLGGLGHAYFQFSRQNPAEFRAMFGRMGCFTEYPHLVDASGESFFILMSAVQALMPPGTTQTEAVPNSLAVWSMIHGYSMLVQHDGFKFVDSEIVPGIEELAKLLTKAIRA